MLRVGVLYGGRSGEHDVSLCSAASIVSALDPQKYEIVAIGIDRDGRWYVQDRPVIVESADFGRVLKLEKKVKAGAQFIQTQLVYDIATFQRWLEALEAPRADLPGKAAEELKKATR